MSSEADEVIQRLLSAGYAPSTLALILERDLGDIEAIGRATDTLIPHDEALEVASRRLAWRALEESMRLLDEGTVENRIKVISKVMGPLAAMMANNEDETLTEIRSDMDALIKEIRDAPGAADDAAEDPDEGPVVGDAPPELGAGGVSSGG